jgi:carboxypeptidase Taq
MSAAQLFDAALKQDGDILDGIAKGDFVPLLTWLRTNVHGPASSRSTQELMRRATGKTLDAEIFKAHLKRRYLD